jgi:soluble cytochrome b562
MKLKVILTTLIAFAIGFQAPVRADDTPLAKNMSGMNKLLRTLKRQIGDAAKKDENVGIIGKIKTSIAEAAKLEPKQTKDIPEAEKAAYLEKYKTQMAELNKTFEAIEAAVTAGKADDAKALFDKLSEQKEKGHKDFGADDE